MPPGEKFSLESCREIAKKANLDEHWSGAAGVYVVHQKNITTTGATFILSLN
jgi:hypothetical protein